MVKIQADGYGEGLPAVKGYSNRLQSCCHKRSLGTLMTATVQTYDQFLVLPDNQQTSHLQGMIIPGFHYLKCKYIRCQDAVTLFLCS